MDSFNICRSPLSSSRTIIALFAFVAILLLTNILHAQHIIDKIMQNPPALPDNAANQRPMGRMLGPGLFSHVRPLFEQYSNTTKIFAGTSGGSLYIRDEQSEDIQIIANPQPGWYWSMEGAQWSPDGKFLVAKQIDDREVPQIKLSHRNADEVSQKPYTRAGQKLPQHQFYVVNIQTGPLTLIEHGLNDPYVHVLGWSSDSETVRLLRSDRLFKKLNLLEAEASSGKVSTIFSEQSDSFLVGLNLLQGYSDRLLSMNLVSFLDDQEQFIYTSERTGFNQLYLYNMQGVLIRPLTDKNKNGIVSKLLDVDARSGWVYYTAQSNDQEPYQTQVFRTSLTSSKIEKLADGPTVLDVFFSPAMDSLWVWRADLTKMMQIDLITAAGKPLQTTWTANLAPLAEVGLNPEYAQVRADDNKTILEALVLKPKDFDAKKEYPVVEYIYGGSNDAIVPRTVFDRSMWNMQNLANEGFIVVMMDTRGTPLRGKEFQDYSYGRFGQVEIQEHVAVIENLGKTRPYMDLNKVGIVGYSWGGHFALQGLIQAPEFYKAGHVSAAAIDPINFRVAIEPFMGCLPKDCPDKYQQAEVTSKLANLRAPLMIVHGSADDDVPITEAYQLIEALKAINYTNYTYIEYPGADHIVMRDPTWEPTMIEFFVKQLR